MSGTIGNTCNIITILPMSVECYAVNATSNISSDGYINLMITGGTAPYDIQWQTGGSGIFLNNLTYGSYSATVTDYYGDYIYNVNCTVGYNTVKVSEFEKCSGSTGEEVIYTTPIVSLTNDYVYTFVEYGGCYKYIQDTFINYDITYSALTIDEEFTDCSFCVVIPPSPEDQPNLCLTNNIDTSFDFEPAGIDSNQNYTWTSSTNNFVIEYNVNNNRWEIINWTGNGSMIQNTTNITPIGEWINIGNNNSVPWFMSTGVCGPIPLNLIVKSITDATCYNESDGSVVLLPNGGQPPYEYRIPTISLTWSNSPIFNNLPVGLYIAEVRDDNNDIASISFSISNQQETLEYEVSITHTFTDLYNQGVINFDIVVTPSLSNGDQIIINYSDLIVTFQEIYRSGTSSSTPQFNNNVTINKNGSPISIFTSPYNASGTPSCNGSAIDNSKDFYMFNNNSIVIEEGDNINGTVEIEIDNYQDSNNCDCPMYAYYGSIIEITQIQLQSNFNCVTATLTNNVISESISLQGCNETAV
jgi:hypothetical protein